VPLLLRGHLQPVVDPSPLENPRNAAHAWRHFRWMMKIVAAITALAVLAAMLFIYSQNGFASITLYIAAALGVTFSMLLTGALMGLLFLSSGTGHDEAVEDPSPEEWRDQGPGRRR